ncbi:hypothetical protein GCM10019016_090880 [Streptomyces prasinosporus]|uniref:Uridine kinase n=1 Tax=Streptomyces prasinosporus TaxID=68256 RepID=A0ABP6U4R2_9ACTN
MLPSALPHSPGEPAIHTLASRIRRLPPSCGPVRLVAVDGHAGSGKSTFAGLLADRLGAAPVLHLDDIARHDELFDWTARLHDEVIGPLSRGATAHYAPLRLARPPPRTPAAAARRAGGADRGRRRGTRGAAPVSGAAAVDGRAA